LRIYYFGAKRKDCFALSFLETVVPTPAVELLSKGGRSEDPLRDDSGRDTSSSTGAL
jgi:hypothetical protein